MRRNRDFITRFCGGAIAVAILGLICAGLLVPPPTFPGGGSGGPKTPVAKIQFNPDQNGQCRHLVFHNDTGRFEQSGMGRCKGLSDDELAAAMAHENRSNSVARVFKAR
jgi:hypothetical protein